MPDEVVVNEVRAVRGNSKPRAALDVAPPEAKGFEIEFFQFQVAINALRKCIPVLPFNIQNSTLKRSPSAAQQSEHAETTEERSGGFWNGADGEVVDTRIRIICLEREVTISRSEVQTSPSST